MSRQLMPDANTPRQRCSQCLRPLSVCYCDQIPARQQHRWPVFIIQDVRESSHAIGTARIAALSLDNCRLISIKPDQPRVSSDLAALQLMQPILIYPGDNAPDIAELAGMPEVPLIFIDASWRRSRKILLTQPWLADLPRYALNTATPSRYRIRQQPTASSLSTLEAIVYTLQQLETQPARFNSVLSTMDWVVDQQIERMGSDTWQSNYVQPDHTKSCKEN